MKNPYRKIKEGEIIPRGTIVWIDGDRLHKRAGRWEKTAHVGERLEHCDVGFYWVKARRKPAKPSKGGRP